MNQTHKPIFNLEGVEGAGKGEQQRRLMASLTSQGLAFRTSREPGGSERGEAIRSVLMRGKSDPFSSAETTMINRELCYLADVIAHAGIPSENLADLVLGLREKKIFSLHLEMALFVAARLVHLEEVIKPFIFGETDDHALILDRFWPSTYAYQVHTRCRTAEDRSLTEFIHLLYDWHIRYLRGFGIKPVFILLDIDPEIGLARIAGREGEVTSFDKEKLPFHQMVRQGYLDLAQGNTGSVLGPQDCEAHIVDASKSEADTHSDVAAIVARYLSMPAAAVA